MANDIRICYRGEYFWAKRGIAYDLDLYGWFIDMPDGSVYDDGCGGIEHGYREFGPFATLREAYDYAVPPESEGPW